MVDEHPDFVSLLNQSKPADWTFPSPAIAAYLQRLWHKNQEINLFSRKMRPDQLVIEHALDCLAALPFFPDTGSLVDLGAGGGMPGIVLALSKPQLQVRLYEKSPLKCQFLNEQTAFVPNLAVAGPLEQVDWSTQTLVTARAFKPLATILAWTQAHNRNGGRYLLYKGKKETIEAELAEADRYLKRRNVRLIPLQIPFDAERHLVEIC